VDGGLRAAVFVVAHYQGDMAQSNIRPAIRERVLAQFAGWYGLLHAKKNPPDDCLADFW
jgi:hypothetical protein